MLRRARLRRLRHGSRSERSSLSSVVVSYRVLALRFLLPVSFSPSASVVVCACVVVCLLGWVCARLVVGRWCVRGRPSRRMLLRSVVVCACGRPPRRDAAVAGRWWWWVRAWFSCLTCVGTGRRRTNGRPDDHNDERRTDDIKSTAAAVPPAPLAVCSACLSLSSPRCLLVPSASPTATTPRSQNSSHLLFRFVVVGLPSRARPFPPARLPRFRLRPRLWFPLWFHSRPSRRPRPRSRPRPVRFRLARRCRFRAGSTWSPW